MGSDPPVKSVKTAFDIVELLVNHGGASLSTVADELDIPMSTVHGHLATLEQQGYVGRSGQKYKANLKFLELGGKVRDNSHIFGVAEQELQKVSNNTGEHSSLMVEENDYGIYVYTASGEHLQQVIVPIGTHTPLHVSAPGKAILAHLPSNRQQDYIEEYQLKPITENTITDPETLTEELEEIREKGHSLDNEEGKRGLQGIAKPVISRDDEAVLGAICVYGPSGRANMEFLRGDALKSLERATNVIEHQIHVDSVDVQ
jgi:DNA-binding IclR family transcriptional regulator